MRLYSHNVTDHLAKNQSKIAIIWDASVNTELVIHRVAYTRYDVPLFQEWQDPTSHDVHILRIFKICVSEFLMFQELSTPEHFQQFSNNSLIRNKSILKFINT